MLYVDFYFNIFNISDYLVFTRNLWSYLTILITCTARELAFGDMWCSETSLLFGRFLKGILGWAESEPRLHKDVPQCPWVWLSPVVHARLNCVRKWVWHLPMYKQVPLHLSWFRQTEVFFFLLPNWKGAKKKNNQNEHVHNRETINCPKSSAI